MRELYVDDDDDDDGGVGGGAPMRPLLGIFGPSFAHLASHDCIVHFFVPPPPPPITRTAGPGSIDGNCVCVQGLKNNLYIWPSIFHALCSWVNRHHA